MTMIANEAQMTIDPELSKKFLSGAISEELGLGENELELGLGVANMRLHSGDAVTALQMYTALVLCAPLNIEYQCGLANCALQMQEHELTLQAASSMIATAPKDCRGYYFSGAACLGMGCFDEAKEDITDAMSFAKESGNGEIYQAALRLNEQLNTKLS